MKKLILLAGILASWAANARASELPPRVSTLPFYKVEARCHGIAQAAGSRSAYAECIYREQLAYDAIKPMWASLPAATQVQCDQVARAESGIGSYDTLNTCVTQGKIPQQEQAVVVGPASAAHFVGPTVETSVWKGEFGGRYWYSSGTTQYGLYGVPPGVPPAGLVSRLTYTGLTGHAGELFGRVDHWSGIFVKGSVGLGTITNGNLQDEDFPPFVVPYSSTNSAQNGGRLSYLTADVGWAFWQPFSPVSGVKAGIFAGYFYYNETVNAYGCTQTATNPVCLTSPPPQPTSVPVITDRTQWNAVRAGLNGVWKVDERLKFTGEAAWLIPFASLTASDAHLLRIGTDFNGPTPIDGHGYGVQLEGILSYNVTAAFSVGVGARYWRIQTQNAGATSHFEQSSIPPGFPQATTVRMERYGGFVQASYNFGAPQGP